MDREERSLEELDRRLADRWISGIWRIPAGARPGWREELLTVRRWMPAEDFRRHLDQVLELNRREGRRFSLHRYRFAAPYPVLEDLSELLPRNLRDGDQQGRPARAHWRPR